MILHCVTYAKFTTAKKHIQVLPCKGILSSVTVTHLILLILFLKIIICKKMGAGADVNNKNQT